MIHMLIVIKGPHKKCINTQNGQREKQKTKDFGKKNNRYQANYIKIIPNAYLNVPM